jgi:prevent-host-death family protein
MTVQVNVQEAKTHLSHLLAEVEAGAKVIIARNGTPIAQLEPVARPAERELGFMTFDIPAAFYEPLTEAELAEWGL